MKLSYFGGLLLASIALMTKDQASAVEVTSVDEFDYADDFDFAQVDVEAPPAKKEGTTVKAPAPEITNYKKKYEKTKKELNALKSKIKKEKKKAQEKKKRELRKKTIQAKKAALAKENEEGCKGLVPGLNVPSKMGLK